MPVLNESEKVALVTITLWDIPYYEKWWLLEWLGYKVQTKWAPKATFHSNQMHLDWCGHCRTSFGKTLGGRIREGCPSCKGNIPAIERDRACTDWVMYSGEPADAKFLDLIDQLSGGVL